MSEDQHVSYDGGARRSEVLPEYRLIPHSFTREVAKALTEGSANYEHIDGRRTPLTSNWRQGNLKFFLDAVNHLENHVRAYANRLLEFGLFMQGVARRVEAPPEENAAEREYVLGELSKMMTDLSHAGANIAFLVEWQDSGALVNQMAAEVFAVQQLHFEKASNMLAAAARASQAETTPTPAPEETTPEPPEPAAPPAEPAPDDGLSPAMRRFIEDAKLKAEKEQAARLALLAPRT